MSENKTLNNLMEVLPRGSSKQEIFSLCKESGRRRKA